MGRTGTGIGTGELQEGNGVRRSRGRRGGKESKGGGGRAGEGVSWI